MNGPLKSEINRRDMLKRITAGFGYLGLAGLLRQQARAGIHQAWPTFCAQGQASDFSVHERRPVAHRHVRPEACAEETREHAADRQDLQETQHYWFYAVAVQVREAWAKRH